jgi:hypothetical protein
MVFAPGFVSTNHGFGRIFIWEGTLSWKGTLRFSRNHLRCIGSGRGRPIATAKLTNRIGRLGDGTTRTPRQLFFFGEDVPDD